MIDRKITQLRPPPSEAANAVTHMRRLSPVERARLEEEWAAKPWRADMDAEAETLPCRAPDRLRDSALAQIGLGVFVGLVVLGLLAWRLP